MAFQLLVGLDYINEKKIEHQYIKMEKILTTKEENLKLGDLFSRVETRPLKLT